MQTMLLLTAIAFQAIASKDSFTGIAPDEGKSKQPQTRSLTPPPSTPRPKAQKLLGESVDRIKKKALQDRKRAASFSGTPSAPPQNAPLKPLTALLEGV